MDKLLSILQAESSRWNDTITCSTSAENGRRVVRSHGAQHWGGPPVMTPTRSGRVYTSSGEFTSTRGRRTCESIRSGSRFPRRRTPTRSQDPTGASAWSTRPPGPHGKHSPAPWKLLPSIDPEMEACWHRQRRALSCWDPSLSLARTTVAHLLAKRADPCQDVDRCSRGGVGSSR